MTIESPVYEAYAAHNHQTHSVNIILDFSICRNRNIHMKLFNRKYKKNKSITFCHIYEYLYLQHLRYDNDEKCCTDSVET